MQLPLGPQDPYDRILIYRIDVPGMDKDVGYPRVYVRVVVGCGWYRRVGTLHGDVLPLPWQQAVCAAQHEINLFLSTDTCSRWRLCVFLCTIHLRPPLHRSHRSRSGLHPHHYLLPSSHNPPQHNNNTDPNMDNRTQKELVKKNKAPCQNAHHTTPFFKKKKRGKFDSILRMPSYVSLVPIGAALFRIEC